MTELPRGTVTFLFTDIEGSTALWERDRSAMAIAVERHLALLDEAITVHRGVHFKTVGDAVQAAFPTASAALAAAIAGQQAILGEPWPEEIGSLRVRMALHVGTAEPDAGDYLATGIEPPVAHAGRGSWGPDPRLRGHPASGRGRCSRGRDAVLARPARSARSASAGRNLPGRCARIAGAIPGLALAAAPSDEPGCSSHARSSVATRKWRP